MRNSIGQYTSGVRSTWSYKHKHVLVTLSLLTAVVWQGLELGQYLPHAEAVTYTNVCTGLECEIEKRAGVIYENNVPFAREQARIDAIREINEDMLGMLEVSPHVDYEALENKYGY